ncbi:hypothetical protein AGMMS49593_00180 [Endomicrobiia bacterium]|nr:hypothetical protein AGMMS49593_00180 [Endomicrobiia bacterium]
MYTDEADEHCSYLTDATDGQKLALNIRDNKNMFLTPDAYRSDISKLLLDSYYIRVDLDEAKTNDRILVRLFKKVGIDIDSMSEQHYVGWAYFKRSNDDPRKWTLEGNLNQANSSSSSSRSSPISSPSSSFVTPDNFRTLELYTYEGNRRCSYLTDATNEQIAIDCPWAWGATGLMTDSSSLPPYSYYVSVGLSGGGA